MILNPLPNGYPAHLPTWRLIVLHVIYTLYFILYNHVPLIHKATVVFPGDVVHRNRQKRI
jgi:hypothetical protein